MLACANIILSQGYTPFPHLASWYTQLRDRQPFARVREDIWLYWEAMVQQVTLPRVLPPQLRQQLFFPLLVS